jgi:hypothetical protein
MRDPGLLQTFHDPFDYLLHAQAGTVQLVGVGGGP